EIGGAGGLQAGGEADGAEAAGAGDRHGCSWERGRGRERVEVPGGRRGGPRRPQGGRAVGGSPVVSGRHSARGRDAIADPELVRVAPAGAGGLRAGGEAAGAEAAGAGDRHGCSWERGRGREMVEVPGGRRGGPRRPQGARAVRDSPVVSGRPSARFRDWIAAP